MSAEFPNAHASAPRFRRESRGGPPPAEADRPGTSEAYEALLARLHDTTLQLLEYIARRGDVDEAMFGREVRVLASREATALRELLEGSSEPICALEREVRRIVEEARLLADHEIRFIVGPTDDSVEGPQVAELAAAVREVLTNARKHAAARTVTVYLEVGDGRALVTIKDDGVGVDLDRLKLGLGLRRSVIARMARVGGSARLASAPGEGMLVTLEHPAPDSAGAEHARAKRPRAAREAARGAR
ncbi:MAG TPA: ATP-binding protein [Solirubrobacteraceae bacterium]|nr:ATP-binding protein [Solirubrobacteraceae bacterium]